MSSKILDRIGIDGFNVTWPVSSCWVQTLTPNFLPDLDCFPSHWHEISLKDGDKLVLAENRCRDATRAVLLIHGLVGDYRSGYNVRLTRRLQKLGIAVFRLNLRGAGPGFGLAKKTYHAGQTQDIRVALRKISQLYPNAHCTAIGVSLGASLILKMLGESKQITSALDSFIAVSPPFNLNESSVHLREKCRLIDRYFSKRLVKSVNKLHKHYPELGSLPEFPKNCSVYDFDDLYTAPRHGFKSAEDYYRKSSCGPHMERIKHKGLVLIAKDDPVVGYDRLPKFNRRKIDLVCTNRGGHVGFIGASLWKDFFWMDHLVERWMDVKGVLT